MIFSDFRWFEIISKMSYSVFYADKFFLVRDGPFRLGIDRLGRIDCKGHVGRLTSSRSLGHMSHVRPHGPHGPYGPNRRAM